MTTDQLDLSRIGTMELQRRLVGRNISKAELRFYGDGEQRVVVKTYAQRPWLVRNLAGRWLIGRECGAYEAAQGCPGLARYHGRLGPFALAVQWVDARPLAELPRTDVNAEVFDRLDAILRRLHRRGIAVGDLHHRDVLVDKDGEVTVIDLPTAVFLGDRPGRFRRWLFQRLRESDLVAAARMRARFMGIDEASAVAAVGGSAARWHRRARKVKKLWNRLRGKHDR